MERRVRVYADYREESSGIPSMLEFSGILVFRKNLEIGDYILPGGVVIERKTVTDFAHSLFDGRLFEQASRLAESYDTIIYLIEGETREFRFFQDRIRQLYGALASLVFEYDVKLVYSSSPRDSATIIEALARKAGETSSGRGLVIHKKPRLSSLREWQLYVVSSLPGIGPRLAERLLDHFKTVEAICLASLAELSRVVGERRAERIKTLLKTPYEKPDKSRYQCLDEFIENER